MSNSLRLILTVVLRLFTRTLGTVYLLVAVASLVGTPTAGAFVNVIDQSHFNNLIIFTGCLTLCGGMVLLIVMIASRFRSQGVKY